MSKIIEYREYKILFSGSFYWFNTLYFRTLKKAKIAIDNKIKEDNLYGKDK